MPMSDAPYIAHFEKLQGFLPLLVRVDEADTVISLVLLGKLGGHLGEGLGGCNA